MTKNNKDMENLYDWLFHYNHYTKKWAAFKREDVASYFNGDQKSALYSDKQTILSEIILLTGGDPIKIQQLIEHGTKFMNKVKKG